MTPPLPELGRRYFTVDEANARLPLVRVIITDIVRLATELRDRYEQFNNAPPPDIQDQTYDDDRAQAEAVLEAERDKLETYVEELQQLGAELKDFFIGLIDFPGWVDGREVCLCWKLGEGNIEFWHETDAGYRGRQKVTDEFRRQCQRPPEA